MYEIYLEVTGQPPKLIGTTDRPETVSYVMIEMRRHGYRTQSYYIQA